ncbi:MAG: BlaI/MecI/CopY family transcriptional regulator [Clostridia bacterium]|nr:BlaI/MecI/CopY family transcriptional regulator [Clostridia bacterium]
MSDVRLGAVEARFADIVWAGAPLSTAELVKRCEKELQWKRTTTYTVLKRLCERGLFRLEDGTVTVVLGRDEFYAKKSAEFVEDSFQGSLPAFFAAFTSGKRLSQKEIDELQAMIDRLKGNSE